MDSIEAVICEIVESALEAEVRSLRRPPVGNVAETYLLELGDRREHTSDRDRTREASPRRAVCKIGGASIWTGDVIEPLVVDFVESTTDLPVPSVLASGLVDPTPIDGSGRWALYEHLVGENPHCRYRSMSPDARSQLLDDAGDLLGRLHAAHSFDRVAGIGYEDGRLTLCDPIGPHVVTPGGPPAVVKRLRRSSPLSTPIPDPLIDVRTRIPVLCHGDYHPGNLLVEDGRVSAVLDWGNAHVTHAGYAFARAEARFVDVHRLTPRNERRADRRTFREAYARHAPIEPDFDRHAPIYKLCWLAQSAANYATIVRTPRGRMQIARQLRNGVNRR